MSVKRDNFILWAMFWALKPIAGLYIELEYQKAKGEYKRSRSRSWRCDLCLHKLWGKKGPESITVDHIIPKSILWELGLPQLIFDKRNFRLAHQLCNIRRGLKTARWSAEDLPEEERELLATLKESI